MDPDELYQIVRHQPFEPFRIHVSDGSIDVVKHPDQIVIGRRACHVGMGGARPGPFQEIAIVANVQIARLERRPARRDLEFSRERVCA